jgi:hypothetical protein
MAWPKILEYNNENSGKKPEAWTMQEFSVIWIFTAKLFMGISG